MKTNPILPRLPRGALPGVGLTAKQLYAARQLVRGVSSDRVAEYLKTTRQTVNRWRQKPAFVAEMTRLHEALMLGAAAPVHAAAPIARPARAAGNPLPARPARPAPARSVPDDDDFSDVEEMIDNILKRKAR